MEVLSSNEAKTHFGDLLLKVQREPVQINRNGKAVAIVISVDDYLNFEALKMQQLKNRVEQVQEDIAAGRTIDGSALFEHVLQGGSD